MKPILPLAVASLLLLGTSCGASDDAAVSSSPTSENPDENATSGDSGGTQTGGGEEAGEKAGSKVYAFANGCFAVRDGDQRYLSRRADKTGFGFEADKTAAEHFFMKASDLGTYLLYDRERGYLVSEDAKLKRATILQSDIMMIDDSYQSPAEWAVMAADESESTFVLRHRKTGRFVGQDGLVLGKPNALVLTFEAASDCAEHPELTLDAEGEIAKNTFEDGALYGIVDTHSHVLSNFGFGGGGVFHGAPFHRLGVEHALSDCERFHGKKGRKDFFGYGFSGGAGSPNLGNLLPALITGELTEDNHETVGYPDFTDWPDAHVSSTHQTQYYLWLKRAYLAGLRLEILHATTNEIICDFMVGQGYQKTRYSCSDMLAVDRIIDEAYAMERYIDAQEGGPGKGFFRLVKTPEAAREVIKNGKMAVVLGIETSNLFDCLSVPRKGSPTCDEAYVKQQLDSYYERGVRALFPVHKYDNAFSAGDGNRGFIELGNFLNSGHWSNFVTDCPENIPAAFDHGDVAFGGLNEPRDEYMSKPPNDMSNFAKRPILTVTPHILRLQRGSAKGDYCQNAGLTPLGEMLIHEMMLRGMILEIDHFPQRSYERAFQMLEEYDYPAAATHGTNFEGRLYALGGVSKTGLGRCRDPERADAMLEGVTKRTEMIAKMGGYPAEGFGFDLNGFAGAPGPRFGELARCDKPQEDPVTYPFKSYAGDVTFTKPRVGKREIDFNTEGLSHIGLLPELIEDAREGSESDAKLEPLFRSAEGYLRMWERAEERAKALRGGK